MPLDPASYLPVRTADIVQILLIWVVLYWILRVVKGTIAGTILRGAVLLGAFAIVLTAVVLRAFHLSVVEQIFTAVGNVTVIGLLIVFQQELRRGLLSLGEHRFFSRFRSSAPGDALEDLCNAAARLAREKKGALFAIERESLLHHITRTGVTLDAEARSDLLVTIFWPGSPLHDGGVVLRGDRVAAAACIFPLAERRELASALGTRHRAALGLSEESDAVVVVVSEETGRISIAHRGELTPVAAPDLLEALQALVGPESRPPRGRPLAEAAAEAEAVR